MSSKSLTRELEAIQAIIGESPAGIGIAELEAEVTQRLKAKLVRRTLQRRLDQLLADRRIRADGNSVARVYLRVSKDVEVQLQGVAAIAHAGTVTTEAYVPMSGEGAKIRETVRQALMYRRPVGYQREFLETYEPGVTWYLPQSTRNNFMKWEEHRLAGAQRERMHATY